MSNFYNLFANYSDILGALLICLTGRISRKDLSSLLTATPLPTTDNTVNSYVDQAIRRALPNNASLSLSLQTESLINQTKGF